MMLKKLLVLNNKPTKLVESGVGDNGYIISIFLSAPSAVSVNSNTLLACKQSNLFL